MCDAWLALFVCGDACVPASVASALYTCGFKLDGRLLCWDTMKLEPLPAVGVVGSTVDRSVVWAPTKVLIYGICLSQVLYLAVYPFAIDSVSEASSLADRELVPVVRHEWLCCAVLCCAVLCCAVLCCAVSSCQFVTY
jgi:hypothetical protein